MGKASFQKTPLDITRKNVLSDKVLFGINRQNNSNVTSIGSNSGVGQQQSITPTNGFLSITGGSMSGPIGFVHQQCAIIASTLDISSTLVNTSYVIINTGGPNLQAISAVVPTDAFLILNNSSGADITLKQAVGGGMNIDTATHADLLFANGDTIVLIYNHNPGIWHQITSIPLGGGVFANTTLSNLTSPTAINQDLLPHATTDFLNLGNDSHVWAIGNFSVVANVNNIIFGTNSGGTRWIEKSGGLVYNVLTGEAHSFQVNNVEYMDVRGSQVNITGTLTVSGSTNLNGNVSTDADGSRNLGTTSLRFIINGFNYRGISKGAPTPSVTDIPSGYFQVMKDSRQVAGVGVKLWYNDSGTLVSVALS